MLGLHSVNRGLLSFCFCGLDLEVFYLFREQKASKGHPNENSH